MRLNQYLASHAGLSRRVADVAISDGRVSLNGQTAVIGAQVKPGDQVELDGRLINAKTSFRYLVLNKPTGYVCSRQSQGGKTIYDLLPSEFGDLKNAGRLDKDSSGLLLLTDDGQLIQAMTHPKYAKEKVYHITVTPQLAQNDAAKIEAGVKLDDGPSKLKLRRLGKIWEVRLSEGRNRQIRRTFAALGYRVVTLNRTEFGSLQLGDLAPGQWRMINGADL